ncbi:hypothetical protein Tco_1292316 [Tanacetum coccineum]
MGRDTIQLETAVSTISLEYLLEFTSEYGISEDLHPELPSPKERIMDFLEGKVEMDLFNLITTSNPTKVKTGTRPRVAHEVPLLTATTSHVINMEELATTTESSGTLCAIEKSPLDYDNENPSQQITEGDDTGEQVSEIVAPETPPPGNVSVMGATLEVGLEEPVAAMRPPVSKKRRKMEHCRRKSLALIGLEAGSTLSASVSQETPTDVSNPNLLSYAKSQSTPKRDIAQSSKATTTRLRDPSKRGRDKKKLDQEIKSLKVVESKVHGLQNRMSNLKTLLEAKVDMKKAAKAKNMELSKKLDSLRFQFSDLQYEDDRVEQRCAEMDSLLDKLSIDFDEELYPHMLTAIAGHRWVIGHGLRLAVMKCTESSEIRQAFADIVFTGLAKGMSEGLKFGIEHEKAGHELADVKAYDPETNNKLVKALQDQKDLKYPIVDKLERLKDAPMDLIMASLHLESDIGADAPQWLCDICPSSSQLKIPIYPEVRDPKDLWVIKEEVLLEDAITANVSRAEKKKKCRVVCHTYVIESAHHTRSNGISVSVPTVDPQGLAILVANAAT